MPWLKFWRAARLPVNPRDDHATPIHDCAPGTVVDVLGTVRTIRKQPEAPALEIELDDGTGTVTCIWLGRCTIEGIEPGTRMAIHGRITCAPDRRTIFNPRYELRPVAS